MRILHTADWHIGKTLYDYSLLEDQEYWAKGLFSLIKKEKIQLLLIAGDLYDRAVPSAAAVSLLDWIFCTITQDIGIPICAIPGNHDSSERLQFGTRLFTRQGLHLKTVYQKEWEREVFQDEWGPLNVWFLPYTDHLALQKDFPEDSIHCAESAYRAWASFNRSRVFPEERNIALAHGFFADFPPEQKPQEKTELQKELLFTEAETLVGTIDLASCRHFSCFDFTALGHLHGAQSLGNGNVRYAGSPLKYSVSESRQEKSVTLLDVREKGQVKVETRQIPALRDLREITGPFESLCAIAAQSPQEREDYVAVGLTDREPILEPMRRLRKLFPHILELRFVEQKGFRSSPLSPAPSLQPLDRLQDFYRQVSGGKELTQAQLSLAQKAFREAEQEEVDSSCTLSD